MILVFHRTFKKQYKKVPFAVQSKFDERLRIFKLNMFDPLLNNHSLAGDRDGEWSINVTGDWRAVYVFNSTSIVFTEIGTHDSLYKK
ncbi:MAG TPA: type II toxin-antitoxin system YafQ family toxin [Candidatus Paceibacterota bacterium]